MPKPITTLKYIAASLAASVCLFSLPADAQTLTITPSNTTVTGGVASFTVTKGTTFTFLANLTSTGGSLSLNSDNADFFTAPGPTELNPATSANTLALDDSVFFNSLPRTLAGTQNNVSLFTVSAGTSAVTGLYTGYFTIQGGPAPTTTTSNDLATVNYRINVVAAPEPSALVSLVLGTLCVTGRAAARRRQS